MTGPAWRLALVALSLVAGLLTAAAPAWAHAGLRSSDPAGGASVPAPPAEVTLTFDQPVEARFVRIEVRGPAGTGAAAGAARVDGAVVRQPVTPAGAGRYVVEYRVVSADGHPVQGSISFTAAGPGDAAATPPAPVRPSGAVPPSGAAASGAAAPDTTPLAALPTPGRARWPSLLGVGLLAVAAGGGAVWLRRRAAARGAAR